MPQRQKHALRKLFLAVTIPVASLCVTFILLYLFVPTTHREPITPPTPVAVVTPTVVHETTTPPIVVSQPVRLQVASISVNALITPVGMNATGNMDIDENPTQLAWYKLGPKPGEEGSAVIAGHYGWKDSVPSVFNDLNKLAVGDKISTYGEDGVAKTFKVTRTALYMPDQDATDVFRSDDGKAHLNLVTCQGSWNNSARTYSERLVVFSDYVAAP